MRRADTATRSSAYRRALQLNPDISNANAFMGNALMQLNKMQEARTAIAAEKSDMFRLTGLAILEHRAGNTAAAKASFRRTGREARRRGGLSAGGSDGAMGQGAEAADRLERRARSVTPGLTAIATDPMLDPIAKDPNSCDWSRNWDLRDTGLSQAPDS